MPSDVKTRAIVALTRRVNATGRDLDAARLLSRCSVKVRAVETRGTFGALGNPAADIMVHADHETLIEARRTGATERIRRAVRDALGDTPLHRIQWAETAGPRSGGMARRVAASTGNPVKARPAAGVAAGKGNGAVPGRHAAAASPGGSVPRTPASAPERRAAG